MADFTNTINNDSLTGTDGNDRFLIPDGQAGAGDDTFYSGAGHDIAYGGAGSDALTGGTGNDRLFGGDDVDHFYVSSTDADVVDGGSGEFNYIWLQEETSGVTVDMTAGTLGAIRFTNINYVTATSFADRMLGGAGNDNLHGSGGSDVIRGGQGHDYIGLDFFGQTDRDKGYGGAGNDYLQSTGHGDRVFGGAGRDLLQMLSGSDVTLTLGSGRRFAQVEGAGRTIFRGIEDVLAGEGDDTIAGSRADNWLRGAGGKDSLSGGDGNDRLDGDVGRDRLTGDDGIDQLFGGDGRDRLTGGSGGDFILGGAGRDLFIFTDTTDSTIAALDRIEDFARGDKIDLRGLTHSGGLGAGDVDLTWIGTAAFSATGDEIRLDGNNLMIRVGSLWGLEMQINVLGEQVRQQDVLL